MTTLATIKKKIEALQKKADAIRKTEVAAAVKTVRDLISQFGLTAQDVGLGSGRSRSTAKAVSTSKVAGTPKYRDPKTGKTWTGHGKPPGWIAGAVDRTKFLIDGQGDVATAAAPKAPRAAKAVKATAAKVAQPAKKASATKVAKRNTEANSEEVPVVKKASRVSKAVAGPAAPAKKVSAAPKADKPAAKKAVPKKTQDKSAVAAVPAEAA